MYMYNISMKKKWNPLNQSSSAKKGEFILTVLLLFSIVETEDQDPAVKKDLKKNKIAKSMWWCRCRRWRNAYHRIRSKLQAANRRVAHVKNTLRSQHQKYNTLRGHFMGGFNHLRHLALQMHKYSKHMYLYGRHQG